MLGINDYLTSGGHFEFLKNNGTVGTTSNFKIGNYGVAGISLASNIKNFGHSQRVNCGYTYESEYFDFNSNLDWNNKNYRDVYNYPNKTYSNLRYQISASYGDGDIGNISVNFLTYAIKGTLKNKRSNIISVTYQKNITKRGVLNFTIGTDLKNRHTGNFAYLSFNLLTHQLNT
ncbi:hypothetical protein [Rickettsia endosymbiont of Rhinocyllus conicus]|uniref:hypothetical protein n=1 Tax=Rickettsia endosymbiont of Rhinocyllus conicus TaxID=3066252 RepID=UPI0031334EE2